MPCPESPFSRRPASGYREQCMRLEQPGCKTPNFYGDPQSPETAGCGNPQRAAAPRHRKHQDDVAGTETRGLPDLLRRVAERRPEVRRRRERWRP